MKKTIVVSGINLVSGGTLSIFRDCLSYINTLTDKYEIIALVNNKNIFNDISEHIIYFEYPLSKKSWLLRCFYEYIYFYFFSKKIKPYLWLSLHDITPNVNSEIRAVYCHNSSPFYTLKARDYLIDIKFTLFTFFYKYLYELNIKKNDVVIVQQDWLRNKFKQMYGIDNIIVAHPKTATVVIPQGEISPKTFIYPTFPRVFKNIELICEAFKLIDNLGTKVYITIDGTENAYAKNIVKKYSDVSSVNFIGLQDRKVIFEYYGKVAALLFPSRLETWGMPLSEFRLTGKPIFASDMNFCHETLAGYDNAVFFDPTDAAELANLLKSFILNGTTIPVNTLFVTPPPFAADWESLFDMLLSKKVL